MLWNFFKNHTYSFFTGNLTLHNFTRWISFFVLTVSLFIDYFQVGNEIYNDNLVKIGTCQYFYNINHCEKPIQAVVTDCLKWLVCSQKKALPGTLVWAEVIKRFINNILALDSHALITIFLIIFVMSLFFVDNSYPGRFLAFAKDIILIFLICATVVCCAFLWITRRDLVDYMNQKNF